MDDETKKKIESMPDEFLQDMVAAFERQEEKKKKDDMKSKRIRNYPCPRCGEMAFLLNKDTKTVWCDHCYNNVTEGGPETYVIRSIISVFKRWEDDERRMRGIKRVLSGGPEWVRREYRYATENEHDD